MFQQSFLQFAGRMTGAGRYQNGLKQMKANAALLSRIEQRTGVPPAVVTALWGLESDYGAYKGGVYNIIRSVATLAYDCRRRRSSAISSRARCGSSSAATCVPRR